jgi:hypothetical protein
MVQGIKLRLEQGDKRRERIKIEVRKGCCLSPILFNFYSEYLIKEDLEKFGDFKMEEQVIWTLKYADDLVLLAKGKTVLLRMIDRLMKIERCYEIEINVEKF